MKKNLAELQIGEGVTLHGYSDATAYTIIHKTAKSMKIQRDKVEHINKKDLEFHIGGFSAHCSNQNGQQYSYERDLQGSIETIRLRQCGRWKTAGQTSGAMRASEGRHEFYDFNF
jgi:hypothetical protein